MKCFIASAFDHEEVDAVYDRAIRPVLKELKLIPLRVDRLEHNEDIDDKIFQLIDDADICIADLTHARPSVYYEAGYARGLGKPVIYIARADHFRPKDSDRAGNLRVHFDLQMKNIIPWTSPNMAFHDRLCNRLRHVLKPLERERTATQQQNAAEMRFGSMSQHAQVDALIEKGRHFFFARGFRWPDWARPAARRVSPFHLLLHRFDKGVYQQILIAARSSLTKTELAKTPSWIPLLKREQREGIAQYDFLLIIPCLQKVREMTIASSLPGYAPLTSRVFTRQVDDEEVSCRHTIAVVDAVRSEEQYVHSLQDLAARLNLNRGTGRGNLCLRRKGRRAIRRR